MKEEVAQAAFEVYRLLGSPGLLENIYESALCHELHLRGLQTQRQVPIPVIYKSTEVRTPLFLDILVENRLIIEIKANGKDYPFYETQLFTYLRLMGVYRNELKNRFLTTSISPQNYDLHSRLAHEQWSLAPDQNFEGSPCQIPDSSIHFGIKQGLLINFGKKEIKDGICHIYNDS